MATSDFTTNIPYGYCHCGCGQKTSIATKTDSEDGIIKGLPNKYIQSHNRRFRYGAYTDKFWTKVNKNGSIPEHAPHLGQCWEWTGMLDHHGYGRIQYDGKKTTAHRLSWELSTGTKPVNTNVLHKCDNPRCVRPDHLFIGTPKDNGEDMAKKGRAARNSGEKCGLHKLTTEQVEEIRRMYIPKITSQEKIANIMGVSQSQVGRIIRKENWK